MTTRFLLFMDFAIKSENRVFYPFFISLRERPSSGRFGLKPSGKSFNGLRHKSKNRVIITFYMLSLRWYGRKEEN